MKVKVSFSKDSGELVASLTVLDCEGYYTIYVFQDEEEGRGYAFTRESFPLSLEGLREARRWVSENIARLREEVLFWRNFELPPEEVIEI